MSSLAVIGVFEHEDILGGNCIFGGLGENFS